MAALFGRAPRAWWPSPAAKATLAVLCRPPQLVPGIGADPGNLGAMVRATEVTGGLKLIAAVRPPSARLEAFGSMGAHSCR
jgi:hypothetical protein